MAIQRMAYSTDVREVLGVIAAPTLVLSRASPLPRRALAASGRVDSGGEAVELDGSDHYWWADAAPVLAEIEEFLTGVRSEPVPDRLFATVLFTDIVGSTPLAASLGDAAWTEVLDAHDALVRRQLERYHGFEINTTGDGFVASSTDQASSSVRSGHRGRRTCARHRGTRRPAFWRMHDSRPGPWRTGCACRGPHRRSRTSRPSARVRSCDTTGRRRHHRLQPSGTSGAEGSSWVLAALSCRAALSSNGRSRPGLPPAPVRHQHPTDCPPPGPPRARSARAAMVGSLPLTEGQLR